MPREVKAYACIHRCGQRVNTKKESMEDHEKICFANPDVRACKTCAYWVRISEGMRCMMGLLKPDQWGTSDCDQWKNSP